MPRKHFVFLFIICCAVFFLTVPAKATKSEGLTYCYPDIVAIADTVGDKIVSTATSFAENESKKIKGSKTQWIKQLIDNGFHINDTTINYPAFPRFALKVYNWGDHTFNSYDSTYVVGTGKNWKFQLKSYGWLESQTMLFPEKTRLSMHSNFFTDAGIHLSFMAVSIGYMWNMDKLFEHNSKRNTFNFEFTCSRFTINYNAISSDGGMIITHLGDYNDGRYFTYRFDNAKIKASTIDAYYFFNHNRYSHAAAYCFSKYQRKSAGTAIAGLNLSTQNIDMDFSSLPEDMLGFLPLNSPYYTFHFRDIALAGGYGHNWAFNKSKWTINLTAVTSLGYKRTHEDATDGKRNMVANNYRISLGGVYNYKRLFASAQARFNGFLYFNSSLTHFSTYSSLTLILGIRF